MKSRTLLGMELIRRLVTPQGVHEVDYDPANPAEFAEAKRIFEELMGGANVSGQEFELLEKVLEPSLRPGVPRQDTDTSIITR